MAFYCAILKYPKELRPGGFFLGLLVMGAFIVEIFLLLLFTVGVVRMFGQQALAQGEVGVQILW